MSGFCTGWSPSNEQRVLVSSIHLNWKPVVLLDNWQLRERFHGGSTWITFNNKNKLNDFQEDTKFWVNSPSITLAWDVLLRGGLCNFINVIVLVTVGYKSRLVRWREQKDKSPATPRWPSSIGSSSNKGGRLERGGCGQQELTRPFVYLLFQKENTYLWEKSWEVAKHILPKVNEKNWGHA